MNVIYWISYSIIILILMTKPVKCIITDIVEEYFTSKHLVAATIFACTTEDYIKLFKQSATTYRYVASGSTYLNDNVSFTNSMHYPYHKLGVYLDYTCDFGKRVLHKSSESFIFNSSYVWLIRVNVTDNINDFEDINFGLDSDVILAVESGNENDTVELIDLYKINSTWYLIKTSAGSYNKTTGLSINLNGTSVQRRRDFKGFMFNTAIVTIDLVMDKFDKKSLNKFMNYAIDPESDVLIRCSFIYCYYLTQMYNFTLNIHGVHSFGYPVKVGPIIHDGMMGEIESKGIDFGITPVTMGIKSRLAIAHFALCPMWRFRFAFMFSHPRSLGTYKGLLIPFRTEVWILVVCLTLGIGVILSAVKYFSVDNPINTDKSLVGNIVITIGALYQQGLSSCSNKIPERIILLFTLITGIIIVSFYNSMIVTSLLQPAPKYISTPKLLLESSFQPILQNHTYARNFFGRAKDQFKIQMYEKVLKGPGYLNATEGLALIQKSKYAFYVEESSSYNIIEQTFSNDEICMLQEIELQDPISLYLPVKRNSPLLEFFNQGLLTMKEAGIVQEQFNKWHPRKPECRGSLKIPSVELQSLLVAYLILFSGIVLSILIFIAEIAFTKFKLKRNLFSVKRKLKKRKQW